MSYWEAESKYQGYREAAYEETRHSLIVFNESRQDEGAPAFPMPDLREIDAAAIQWWRKNWGGVVVPDPKGRFRWDEVYDAFRSNDLDRFDIAVWHDGVLCGMCVGRPSSGSDNLTLHFLERYFGPNPLAGRISNICIDAAENYAKILGKQRLRIKRPLDGALKRYERLGFKLDESGGKNAYHVRQVIYASSSA